MLWGHPIKTVMKMPVFERDGDFKRRLGMEIVEGKVKQLVWEMGNGKFLSGFQALRNRE